MKLSHQHLFFLGLVTVSHLWGVSHGQSECRLCGATGRVGPNRSSDCKYLQQSVVRIPSEESPNCAILQRHAAYLCDCTYPDPEAVEDRATDPPVAVPPPTQMPIDPPTGMPVANLTPAPVLPPTPQPIAAAPTAAPVNPTAAPVNPTAAPVNPTAAPVSPTAAPVAPTLAPVSPTTAPVAPTTAPVAPTSAPVNPVTPAPVNPVTPVASPTTSPQVPVTSAPVNTTPPLPQPLTNECRLCGPTGTIGPAREQVCSHLMDSVGRIPNADHHNCAVLQRSAAYLCDCRY